MSMHTHYIYMDSPMGGGLPPLSDAGGLEYPSCLSPPDSSGDSTDNFWVKCLA